MELHADVLVVDDDIVEPATGRDFEGSQFLLVLSIGRDEGDDEAWTS